MGVNVGWLERYNCTSGCVAGAPSVLWVMVWSELQRRQALASHSGTQFSKSEKSTSSTLVLATWCDTCAGTELHMVVKAPRDVRE
jgi:hypothetical protein